MAVGMLRALVIVYVALGIHAQHTGNVSSNFYAPVISYVSEVNEDILIGETIGRFAVSDQDEGAAGRVSCSLISTQLFQLEGLGDGVYAVNTAGELDYEQRSNYSLTLNCIDSSSEPKTAQLNIAVRVKDVNDNPPVITVDPLTGKTYPEIAENAPIGTFVALVDVRDADSVGNREVNCSITSDNFVLVQLYINQYKITTAKSFDREAKDTYLVRINCWDKGRYSVLEHVDIRISDVNDNAPVVAAESSRIQIWENNPINSFLTRISVSDADAGQNRLVNCRLTEEYEDLFKLEQTAEGEFSLFNKVSLDREQRDRFLVLIMCNDLGSVPLQTQEELEIEVLDVNDNAPQFSQASYVTAIRKDAPIGTELIIVYAVDYDVGPNSDFTFSLSDSAGGRFTIDSLTGEIRTALPLVDIDSPSLQLMVTVTGEAQPPLSSTTTVSISLI